jgi:TPR repeat protein/Zn-dependent protease with chaperone function
MCPTFACAGPCDITWDGEALARKAQGYSLATDQRLLDTNKNVVAKLTGAQILAISEAKDAIAKQLGRSPSLIICSDKSPNAFAMNTPNGEVVGVTLGLAKLMDGDRDMAAFVIGHEYGHLVLGHLAAAAERRALLTLLGEVAGVVLEYKTQTKTHVQGLGMDVGILSANLVSIKFDRDQERQADEAGFRYMVAAGFNPLGAIRLADMMQRYGSGGIGLFFDDHPGWPERTARFQAFIKASPTAQATIARTGTKTALATAPPASPITEASNGPQVALVPVHQASDPERSFADGIAAMGKQDFQTGVTALRSSAAAGYAPAQTLLAYLYSEGRAGLPKDDIEAVRLYRLAVAQSDAYARNNLGVMYMDGRGGLSVNGLEAIRLYREAAKQGNPLALYNLGNAYQQGKAGIAVDYNAARKYYQQAADAGNSDALAGLGWLYQTGEGWSGLGKDTSMAVAMYRQAADKGSAAGRYHLAKCYEEGIGGLQMDDVEAVKLLQMAANQGLPAAQNELGLMYFQGSGGLLKSVTEALRLLQLAAAQGDAAADFTIGLLYESGAGVQKDQETAVSWYRKAAAQGHAGAAKRLSDLHVN